jgi:hypothetical protein
VRERGDEKKGGDRDREGERGEERQRGGAIIRYPYNFMTEHTFNHISQAHFLSKISAFFELIIQLNTFYR